MFYRTASASKTKCGFAEYPGYVSTPPKIFLVKTLGGSNTFEFYDTSDCSGTCNERWIETYTGAVTYAHPACTTSSTGNLHTEDELPCGIPFDSDDHAVTGINSFYPSYLDPTVTSSTTKSWFGKGCVPQGMTAPPSVNATGESTESLSSEYTDALLFTDTAAAVPAYSGSFTQGVSTAFNDFSTNHLTLTLRKMEYYLAHKIPLIGTCYKLEWVERFTPDGGGMPVDTPRSYTWDGVTPSGYDPNDPDTWPVTTTYDAGFPSDEGVISIADTVATCKGCE